MIRGVFGVVKGGFWGIRRRMQDGGDSRLRGNDGVGDGYDVMGGGYDVMCAGMTQTRAGRTRKGKFLLCGCVFQETRGMNAGGRFNNEMLESPPSSACAASNASSTVANARNPHRRATSKSLTPAKNIPPR